MELQNDLLLRTIRGEEVERPPVWLMRQAGRILPQYRAIRQKASNFKAFVKQPRLAAEATIQPVDELGVDAAILFSDILVIPEAMGLDYELVEKVGPVFPTCITEKRNVEELIAGNEAAAKLDYVYEAIHLTKQKLEGRVPLIGFAGAPWTLFAYMLEGGGSKTFSKAKRFLYQHPESSHLLLQKITESVIAYLQQKIGAGVQLVQLFDSWAGMLSPAHYQRFALPYLKQICNAIQTAPAIVFAKGAWFALPELASLDCQVLGLDWNTSPQWARKQLGSDKLLQGNLDPCQLYADQAAIRQATEQMIRQFGGRHIVNLGHGVYPDTPLDGVRAFVEAVKRYRY